MMQPFDRSYSMYMGYKIVTSRYVNTNLGCIVKIVNILPVNVSQFQWNKCKLLMYENNKSYFKTKKEAMEYIRLSKK